MDVTEVGPASLEELARKLGSLERECAELRGKVAALVDGGRSRRAPSERVPREFRRAERSAPALTLIFFRRSTWDQLLGSGLQASGKRPDA
jgi:hypothetical protein